jgi:hypothetical protein
MSNLSTNGDNFSEKIANGSYTLVIKRKDTTLDILNNLIAVWSELSEHFGRRIAKIQSLRSKISTPPCGCSAS